MWIALYATSSDPAYSTCFDAFDELHSRKCMVRRLTAREKLIDEKMVCANVFGL